MDCRKLKYVNRASSCADLQRENFCPRAFPVEIFKDKILHLVVSNQLEVTAS